MTDVQEFFLKALLNATFERKLSKVKYTTPPGFMGRVHGRRSTLPVNTARHHGPWTRVVRTEHPRTRPVFIGRTSYSGIFLAAGSLMLGIACLMML